MSKEKKHRGFWGWILWIILLPIKLVWWVVKWIVKAPFRIVGSLFILLAIAAAFLWIFVF